MADREANVDKAASAASGGTARDVVLAEPTCRALGLPPSQPTPRRDVAAGALRLLDPAPVSELAEGFTESLDDLIVGVVEAVQECVLAPRPDGPTLAVRAEVEAASWVDDFIADDATHDEALLAQQAMFQLACLVADAVADALTAPTPAAGRPRTLCSMRVESFDLCRMGCELPRRAFEALRWSAQVATPSRWFRQ